MNRAGWVLLVLMLGCAGAPNASERTPDIELSVRVRAGREGPPIEGARVGIWWSSGDDFSQIRMSHGYAPITTLTDASGIVFAKLPHVETFSVKVEKEGFATWSFQRESRPSPLGIEWGWPRIGLSVDLEPELRVTGKVIDVLGRPLEDGTVYVAELHRFFPIDGHGNYSLHGLGSKRDDENPTGTYHLSIRSGDCPLLKWVFDPRTSPAETTTTVRGGASLSVAYTFSDRERSPPRVGACAALLERVEKNDHFFPEVCFEKTLDTPRDRVDFKTLFHGKYRVAIRARGFGAGVSEGTWLASDDARTITVALRPGRTVTGRVVDSSGSAISGAKVGLGADDPAPALTDESGAFTLEDLPLEEVALTVSKDGFEPVSVLLLAGEHTLAETTLVPR